MSRSVGARVPEPLRRRLDDDPRRQVGFTILVVTPGEDRWPHLTMVSAGELVNAGADRLGLALWPASTGATNLSKIGLATLALVSDGRGFSLRCRKRREQTLEGGDHPTLRGFELQVVDALEDVAPYADLLTGVTYRLHDPELTLTRWSAARAALRAAFA